MNNIRYAHYRRLDSNGKPQARGGMTVAYVVNDKNVVVKSATAYCSDKDNYSRPRGRALASGRLQYPHLSEVSNLDVKDFIAFRDAEARFAGFGRRGKPAQAMI